MLIIPIITIALYLLATGMLIAAIRQNNSAASQLWLWPAIAGVVTHASYHSIVIWHGGGGADMHFFSALSLVGLGMSAMTVLMGVKERTLALGIITFPLAALLLLGYYINGHSPSSNLDWRLQLHAWVALLAYATLFLATFLAIMLWLQERALRRHQLRNWLRALPPLVELETLLFRIISAGFILLSATLLTGALFVDNLLAQHLVHKSILSLLSWLTFGALLLGRKRYGWRGIKAVHWTLAAMILLLLAFSGSQFVLELILKQ